VDDLPHQSDPAPSDQASPPPVDLSIVRRRLDELTAELRRGLERLQALDAERTALQETVLRIEGAIVVLRELAEPSRNGTTTLRANAD
jgi:predicted  nucleic acid-binding Zn-ribbon protein